MAISHDRRRYVKEQLLRQAWLIAEYPETCPELTEAERDYAAQAVERMARAIGIDEF